MCLSTIRQRYMGRGKTIIAFKEFMRNHNGEIRNLMRPAQNGTWEVGEEKSTETTPKIINRRRGFKYLSGFHAYAKFMVPGPGEIWAKVQLRGVHTKGTQYNRVVYVARHCKILEFISTGEQK
jgi:hypothetical protein